MAQVHAIKLDSELSEPLYQLLITKTAEEKQTRIKKFFRREDALRCLFTDLLIRYILIQQLGLKNNDISFEYTSYGKSSLAGSNNFHFNMSHSGEWVVCVTDEKPVGIDIELIAPVDLQIAENFFSDAEIKQLLALKPAEQQSFFYDLWTLKESYVKWKGKGLSIPLNAFSIFIDEQKNITLKSEIEAAPTLFFRQYDLDESYKLAVCTTVAASSNIVLLSMQEIITFFGAVAN